MRRNHPKIAPSHPPIHSPIRGVESTPKTGVGIKSRPNNCLVRAPCELTLPLDPLPFRSMKALGCPRVKGNQSAQSAEQAVRVVEAE